MKRCIAMFFTLASFSLIVINSIIWDNFSACHGNQGAKSDDLNIFINVTDGTICKGCVHSTCMEGVSLLIVCAVNYAGFWTYCSIFIKPMNRAIIGGVCLGRTWYNSIPYTGISALSYTIDISLPNHFARNVMIGSSPGFIDQKAIGSFINDLG